MPAKSDAILMLKARREQMALNKKPRRFRLKRLPRWLHPISVEVAYNKELQWYVGQIEDRINKILMPHIPSLVNQRNQFVPEPARADDWADDGERLMEATRIGLTDIPFNKTTSASVIGNKTNAWNDKEWKKILKSGLGVDAFQREPWLNQELNSFVKENVGLITKMEEDLLSDVEGTMQRSIRAGESSGNVAKKIQERVNVSKSRAKLIARDQVGKLNGQLTELRQTNIGVEKYIWRTAEDERVRESHKRNNGKKFSWDKPPSTGHPGQDIQCRCWAEPDFTPIFEELEPGRRFVAEEVPGVPSRYSEQQKELLKQYPGRERSSDMIVAMSMLGRKRGLGTMMRVNNKITTLSMFAKRRGLLKLSSYVNLSRFAYPNLLSLEKFLGMAIDGKLGVVIPSGLGLNKVLMGLKIAKVGAGFVIKADVTIKTLKRLRAMIRAQRVGRKGVTFRMIGAKGKVVKPVPVKKPKKEVIPSKTERAVRREEERIRYITNKEHGVLFDREGNILKTYIGKESEINIPDADEILFKNNIFTHQHSTSTSFSPSDILHSMHSRVHQLRATSPKYLYSMTLPKNWSRSMVASNYQPLIDLKPDTEMFKKVQSQFNQEWFGVFRREYSKINNAWLNAKKGYVSAAVMDDWNAEATHLANIHYLKLFGLKYTRKKLGTATVIVKPKPKPIIVPKPKSVPQLRKEAKEFFKKNINATEAVKDYTRSKARLLNEYLNKIDPEILYGKKIEHDIRTTIKSLDDAFKEKYTKFSGTSYRGFMFGNNIRDNKLYESLLNKLKVGKTTTFPAYVSSSRSKSYAEAFTTAPKSIFFEIKGKKGMFIDNAVYSESIEKEILFNRNSKFKILDISLKTIDRRQMPYITLEEI
jgi:SPP1 gp7 family putative phage head morphogenesis protein